MVTVTTSVTKPVRIDVTTPMTTPMTTCKDCRKHTSQRLSVDVAK